MKNMKNMKKNHSSILEFLWVLGTEEWVKKKWEGEHSSFGMDMKQGT